MATKRQAGTEVFFLCMKLQSFSQVDSFMPGMIPAATAAVLLVGALSRSLQNLLMALWKICGNFVCPHHFVRTEQRCPMFKIGMGCRSLAALENRAKKRAARRTWRSYCQQQMRTVCVILSYPSIQATIDFEAAARHSQSSVCHS